jgi:hypothetical protein
VTPVGALAITAIVACGAPCLVAQPRPETPHPEWTGHYQIVRGRELGDLKMINPELDEVVIAHLQPWARAKMEATDGVADDTGAVCQPFGLFLYPPSAQFSGFLWLPTPEKIVMVYGPLQINTTGVQRIYLNRASHPANLLPTWNGDSVGRWEGDTLVVDTIGFNSKSRDGTPFRGDPYDPALPAARQWLPRNPDHHRGSGGTDFGLHVEPLFQENRHGCA